jgi:hypothetical protein
MKSRQKWILIAAFASSSVYGEEEIAKLQYTMPKECLKPEPAYVPQEEVLVSETPKLEASNAEVSRPKGICDGCFMVPDCCLPTDFPKAINEAARINVASCNHDMFAYASFIYWYVSQEYMDIGRYVIFNGIGETSIPLANAEVLTPHFTYHPGFKVGIGYSSDKDDWQLEAVYTWMRQKTNFTAGAPITTAVAGSTVVVNPNEWWVNLSDDDQQLAASVSSNWTMNMDLVDLMLSRPFYLGRCLVLKPYTGLSGMFTRQKYMLTAQFPDSTTTALAKSLNWSHSWAVGPSIGMNFLWLASHGIRIEADAGMRLFYERYTKLKHQESWNTVVAGTLPINGYMPTTAVLRPVTDLALGLGWGRYFKDDRFHLDFSASYEFQLFAHENMMREVLGFLANNPYGYSNPIGDLFMHGLTVTGRFDF